MRSRRFFLQITGVGIASVILFVWNKLTLNHLNAALDVKKTLPFNSKKGVSFQGEYIITNLNGSTSVFSSHCTHLGCTINKMENERLVCPCHGSEYNLNGVPLKGPAYKNLKKHNFTFSDDKSNIIING